MSRDHTRHSGQSEPPPPGALVVTTTRYGGVASDLDQSDSKHLYTFLPSTALCKALDLQRAGDFRWGRAGAPFAEAFAARPAGPDSVHIIADALGSGLAENRQYLLWTVLAEKETIAPEHRRPHDGQPIARTYSASYLFDGSHIRLLDANARTLHAGQGGSDTAAWSLPTDIPI
jgi:hypothetical protein